MKDIAIGSTTIGRNKPVYVIAEIGTAHGGDEEKASDLIFAAAEAGADCAKYQMVYADEIVHSNMGSIPLPGGNVHLFERFLELERDIEFYAKLKEITESNGLTFLCTAFGRKSVSYLREIGADAVKIASPELLHLPLLESIANWGVPALMSTGVSTLGDIETALGLLPQDKALLHCVTAYPALPEHYNLRLLANLSAIFGTLVGLSDHSEDPRLVPVLAVLQGACVIEKHITLSRQGQELDDQVAQTPEKFSEMVRAIRGAESRNRNITFSELREEYGEVRIENVLGSGVKKLAPPERGIYRTTNRSILSVREIASGEILTEENIALLRCEKNLQPGLPPGTFKNILGKNTVRSIPSGRGISWEDLLT